MKNKMVAIFLMALMFTTLIPAVAYADESTIFMSEKELRAKRLKFDVNVNQKLGHLLVRN